MPFCTKDSPLSSCKANSDGAPTKCSRNPVTLQSFTQCNRRTEILPLGTFCGYEPYTKCATGTQCRRVFGVRVAEGFPVAVQYCVKVQPVGAQCTNKFRTACESGASCQDGKCVSGEINPVTTGTHAYLFNLCEDLLCAPGMQCMPGMFRGRMRRTCQLPVKTVGKGSGCFNTARFTKVRLIFFHLPQLIALSVFLQIGMLTRSPSQFIQIRIDREQLETFQTN